MAARSAAKKNSACEAGLVRPPGGGGGGWPALAAGRGLLDLWHVLLERGVDRLAIRGRHWHTRSNRETGQKEANRTLDSVYTTGKD